MSVDRMQHNIVAITQQSLARLLGIRRESVSDAARKLQTEGLINCSRGVIKILNRPLLEERACECYATVTKNYQRLLPYNQKGYNQWFFNSKFREIEKLSLKLSLANEHSYP